MATYDELTPMTERAAREAARIMEEAPRDTHSLEELASAVGLSAGRLQRAFIRVYGVSPRSYLSAIKTGELKELLRSGVSVSEAGYEAGFGSNRAIYEHARDGLGMAPSAYRKGGRGVRIQWGVSRSRFGEVAVGATDNGVCCVLFTDDGDPERALRAEFPHAELVRDDSADGHLSAVVALIDGTSRPDSKRVPLDLLGTPFQREVWAALRDIPRGETVSYSQVAERIGRSKAMRAVARACAANHAAVLVPCHRVVRTDRGLGGYRWGLERKERLLAEERAIPRD